MKKDLLKQIAEKGYAVSYAACLNNSTYDIIRSVPAIVTCLSLFVGILGLVCSAFTAKWISVCVLLLSILSLYAEKFTDNIEGYGERGKTHTDQHNRLKNLYVKVKHAPENDKMEKYVNEYQAIEKEFNESSQPKQIVLLSDWFAHFKLFCQKDTRWMDEQLHFKWWKNKMPETAKAILIVAIIVTIVYYCIAVPQLNAFFCKLLFIEK